MSNENLSATPLQVSPIKSSIASVDDPHVQEQYREADGSLVWLLICTRTNIGYAFGTLSQHCETPLTVKRALRYIKYNPTAGKVCASRRILWLWLVRLSLDTEINWGLRVSDCKGRSMMEIEKSKSDCVFLMWSRIHRFILRRLGICLDISSTWVHAWKRCNASNHTAHWQPGSHRNCQGLDYKSSQQPYWLTLQLDAWWWNTAVAICKLSTRLPNRCAVRLMNISFTWWHVIHTQLNMI